MKGAESERAFGCVSIVSPPADPQPNTEAIWAIFVRSRAREDELAALHEYGQVLA